MKTLFAALIFAFALPVCGEEAPTKFVTQILEPTGGKISRPKDWVYSEGHHGPVYMWTISKEDTAGNKPYTTGVRIQTFVGVKEGTGKTPKEFVLDFVEKKKKAADKVIETCDPKDQDLFTRICLQTEEGPHRILYSLFWGRDNLDIVVVTIAGTTKALWETYAPTFDRMNGFELIDMKRFEEKKPGAAAETAKGFATASVHLGYMSDAEMSKRVAVKDLADYVKKLEAVCTEFFAETATAENLDVVAAARPDKHTHVWFVSTRTPGAKEKRGELRKKLEAIAAPKVTGGPIAFAIRAKIAGGKAAKDGEEEPEGPPNPKEWQDALSKTKKPRKEQMHFDDVLPIVWPE